MRSGDRQQRKIKKEEWRKIPLRDLPAWYEVSNLGRVRSLPYIDRRGWRRKEYLFRFRDAEINLTLVDGSARCFAVAALVLRAFVGPPPKGMRLSRHLDDDRTNNQVENLAWGTDADNIRDAMRNGYSYVTRGHLGKKHSEATKQRLSELASVPHGRKMTNAHKAALLAGYRKKFPVKKKSSVPCSCGCGLFTLPGRVFIHGHAGGMRFKSINPARIGRPRAW